MGERRACRFVKIKILEDHFIRTEEEYRGVAVAKLERRSARGNGPKMSLPRERGGFLLPVEGGGC